MRRERAVKMYKSIQDESKTFLEALAKHEKLRQTHTERREKFVYLKHLVTACAGAQKEAAFNYIENKATVKGVFDGLEEFFELNTNHAETSSYIPKWQAIQAKGISGKIIETMDSTAAENLCFDIVDILELGEQGTALAYYKSDWPIQVGTNVDNKLRVLHNISIYCDLRKQFPPAMYQKPIAEGGWMSIEFCAGVKTAAINFRNEKIILKRTSSDGFVDDTIFQRQTQQQRDAAETKKSEKSVKQKAGVQASASMAMDSKPSSSKSKSKPADRSDYSTCPAHQLYGYVGTVAHGKTWEKDCSLIPWNTGFSLAVCEATYRKGKKLPLPPKWMAPGNPGNKDYSLWDSIRGKSKGKASANASAPTQQKRKAPSASAAEASPPDGPSSSGVVMNEDTMKQFMRAARAVMTETQEERKKRKVVESASAARAGGSIIHVARRCDLNAEEASASRIHLGQTRSSLDSAATAIMLKDRTMFDPETYEKEVDITIRLAGGEADLIAEGRGTAYIKIFEHGVGTEGPYVVVVSEDAIHCPALNEDLIGLSSLMHGLPDHIVSFNRIGAFLQSASDGGPVRCIAKEDNGLYQCVFQALTSEELEHYKTIRAHGGRMASIDFVTSNLSSSIACASVVDHAIDEDVKVGEAFTSDGLTIFILPDLRLVPPSSQTEETLGSFSRAPVFWK